MPPIAHQQTAIASRSSALKAGLKPFGGFAAPTSNTTYTPNQFFDVCLPHSSRGVARLVAYMIRKTLGWCDADGNPQQEQILVSYQELVNQAGISREMIRGVIDEAIAGHFIRCIRAGRSKTAGDAGEKALYELAWDDSGEYIKDPRRFRGFFEGEGNRTDIPNQFFDQVLPNEPLAVIKVVGSIIRFSIGFQERHGRRRQQVRLSYSDIQRYAHIPSRPTLSQALKTAQARNYLVCIEAGRFDTQAGRQSRAALYGLKWADAYGSEMIGQKNKPGHLSHFSDHRSEKQTGDRSEKQTGIGQKTKPGNRSEIQTGIEMKYKNETCKQQAPVAAAHVTQSCEMLIAQGFDAKTAQSLAGRYPQGDIEDQIRWLALRTPARNALGMLRRAIEEHWPDPTTAALDPKLPGAVFAAHFYAALAGNDGQPVAEPSAADAAAGGRYLQRLSALEKAIDPAHWGRALGRMVAGDAPGLARGGVSLATALRLHGDGFYRRHQAALKAQQAKAQQAAREAHQAAHRPHWIAYLRAEERRIKKQSPERCVRFEAHRAEERRRMLESRWVIFTPEQLARFDGEERRVLDFQAFFADEVLGFWEWDAQRNSQTFAASRPLTTIQTQP